MSVIGAFVDAMAWMVGGTVTGPHLVALLPSEQRPDESRESELKGK